MPLTKNDLKQLGQLMDNKLRIQRNDISSELDNKLRLQREQINEDMEEKMKRHRSNFQQDIDPILKEVKASREERVAQNNQIRKNSDNIQKLQKAVYKN